MVITRSVSISDSKSGYPIHIGHNLLGCVETFRTYVADKQVFILSQPSIARHYLSQLKTTCTIAGATQINSMLIPKGEAQKSLAAAEQIWCRCLKHNLHRDAVLIALGGGVIGDLGGFCAACFHRGMTFIQCPTSLIAQVDAAVGGKTAINLQGIKNAIGLFYQPQAVIVDVDTLNSLPFEEYRSGLAELVKYGLGLDRQFFSWLEKKCALLLNKAPKALHDAIDTACALKAAVVSRDSHDRDERLHLNLGHTVGHALEALTELRHGEAVAIGMVVAARLALLRGNITRDVLVRLISLLESMGLPTHCPQAVSLKAVLRHIRFDKKHLTHQTRWVLLKDLGQSYIAQDVTDDEILAALNSAVARVDSGVA